MEAKALSKDEIETLQNEYELGRKAGIREVVEWIKRDIAGSTKDVGRNVVLCEDGWHTVYGDTMVLVFPNQEWQAKLKEWGIK